MAALGRLDILINMASIYVPIPFSELTVEEYDENVAVTCERLHLLARRLAAPEARRRGNIISFPMAVGQRPPQIHRVLPYYVAKTGVIGLTEALALELAPDKSASMRFAPGPILARPPPPTKSWRPSRKPHPLAAGAASSQSRMRCWRS